MFDSFNFQTNQTVTVHTTQQSYYFIHCLIDSN